MSEFDGIVAQARALGEAIASHPRMKDYVAAQEAVSKDESARKLLGDHQQHVQHIHELEAGGKPIEVTDKHKLRDLQTGMSSNEALKRLMRAQADYLELMNRVNEAMEATMAVDAKS